MKFGELRSIGHNLADSLACGCGFLVGYYSTDVFGEAVASPAGFIEVDFLAGDWSGGPPSKSLAGALRLYATEGLDQLCARHGTDRSAFSTLKVRFAIDRVHGPHFTVITGDRHGRLSEDRYLGSASRRVSRRRIDVAPTAEASVDAD